MLICERLTEVSAGINNTHDPLPFVKLGFISTDEDISFEVTIPLSDAEKLVSRVNRLTNALHHCITDEDICMDEFAFNNGCGLACDDDD